MKTLIVLLAAVLTAAGCARSPAALPSISPEDSARIAIDNLAHREKIREFFLTDKGSPFRRDSSIRFTEIKWFPVDVRYCVTSPLHRYAAPETVTVMGTRGESRRNLKYGYFEFLLPDTGGAVLCRLNVYKFTPYDGQRYLLYKNQLSVWFTDRTTGLETYHVGRYVEIGEEVPDPGHQYAIDFNKAYNPYCAYDSSWICPIPPRANALPFAVRAGMMDVPHP
jgi:uncharacterized protein (DUF1684 family)